MITPIEILIILIPSILGYSLSALCPVSKSAGKSVPFRPPSYVFAIVWPILFLCLGISMMLAFRKNTKLFWLYITTTLFIVSWIVFYNCLEHKLISCILFSETTQRILMSLLLLWCIFSSVLNIYEINTK